MEINIIRHTSGKLSHPHDSQVNMLIWCRVYIYIYTIIHTILYYCICIFFSSVVASINALRRPVKLAGGTCYDNPPFVTNHFRRRQRQVVV